MVWTPGSGIVVQWEVGRALCPELSYVQLPGYDDTMRWAEHRLEGRCWVANPDGGGDWLAVHHGTPGLRDEDASEADI